VKSTEFSPDMDSFMPLTATVDPSPGSNILVECLDPPYHDGLVFSTCSAISGIDRAGRAAAQALCVDSGNRKERYSTHEQENPEKRVGWTRACDIEKSLQGLPAPAPDRTG
jgi:hypothetical protein